MAWDGEAARETSRQQVALLGFPDPPAWFPPIEGRQIRATDEIVDRALTLNVVINCAYGMRIEAARAWLSGERLLGRLTPDEATFIDGIERGADPISGAHQVQVERLWVLAWAVAMFEDLRWDSYCGDELAGWMPDLRANESTARFRSTASPRRADEQILQANDLAFCLTWGCAESNLRQQPSPGDLEQYVMWERRAALEWLRGDDWDHPSLDT